MSNRLLAFQATVYCTIGEFMVAYKTVVNYWLFKVREGRLMRCLGPKKLYSNLHICKIGIVKV